MNTKQRQQGEDTTSNMTEETEKLEQAGDKVPPEKINRETSTNCLSCFI